MNAEFNWWLLVVGVVAGAGLAWLVLGDWSRTEADLDAREREVEAVWIADALRDHNTTTDPLLVEGILKLHRDYLTLASPADDWMIEADGMGELDDDWDASDQAVVDASDEAWPAAAHRSIRDSGSSARGASVEPAAAAASAGGGAAGAVAATDWVATPTVEPATQIADDGTDRAPEAAAAADPVASESGGDAEA